MSQQTEQEILSHEAELLRAKQTLDIKALSRIYAEDLMLTGVLGEPTCSKLAVIEEVQRGIAEREKAIASGKKIEMSAENEDVKVSSCGDAAVANYRFVVKVKGENLDIHRKYRTTNVWARREGRWQIVAAHTSLIFDMKQLAALGG
ncbi:MAG TPA: nuclear transport factor 2 family protein [Terriglobia bacterium]|nr:nuclear transport factor 2 family protein [Terriglobia bacterium]